MQPDGSDHDREWQRDVKCLDLVMTAGNGGFEVCTSVCVWRIVTLTHGGHTGVSAAKGLAFTTKRKDTSLLMLMLCCEAMSSIKLNLFYSGSALPVCWGFGGMTFRCSRGGALYFVLVVLDEVLKFHLVTL